MLLAHCGVSRSHDHGDKAGRKGRGQEQLTPEEQTPTCSPQAGIHLPAAPPLDLRAEPEVCGRLPADRREPCFTSVSDLWASPVLPTSDQYEPTSSYIRAGLETRQDCVCV